MRNGGLLVYRCRRCQKESKIVHVPSGVVALSAVMTDGQTPRAWGDAGKDCRYM